MILIFEGLVYLTFLPTAQLPLRAQRALQIHSDPLNVCADVTQPSDTNHLILYISFLRDIQIWGPGLLLPFWHLNTRAVDSKCWHWLQDIIPLLNLSFFTSKTQITALIHPQCLRAYAHALRLEASTISIRSPSFVRLDRTVGRRGRKKKILDTSHTCLTQFLQQKLRFTDTLYNRMARQGRTLQSLKMFVCWAFFPFQAPCRIKIPRKGID